jgi:lipid-A-disaccharide synthase
LWAARRQTGTTGGANISMPPTIFISAGEASGEHYGALLAAALNADWRKPANGATVWHGRRADGGGGRGARGALGRYGGDGTDRGGAAPAAHLPASFRKLKKAIRMRRPDVAVLIDFPEIHFRLAREFHRLGVPVIFFVSPQLWAWKKHRIKLVQKYIRKMLVIFPFEEAFYRRTAWRRSSSAIRWRSCPAHHRPRAVCGGEWPGPGATWIGVLPGSRAQGDPRPPAGDAGGGAETAVGCARRRFPAETFEFIVPLAPTLSHGPARRGAADRQRPRKG